MSSPPTSRPATNPWLDEPEEFQSMGNQNLRTHQQRVIAQQDEGLDALSRVISHQKQMAVDIGNECDTQNEIIDDIGDHMDKINERLIKETRHIKIVDKKSNTCCKSDFFLFFLLYFIYCQCPLICVHRKSEKNSLLEFNKLNGSSSMMNSLKMPKWHNPDPSEYVFDHAVTEK
eukprot:XP_014788611.1 PREDICTED: syntaxin-8-like [Octopus bimaculoides]